MAMRIEAGLALAVSLMALPAAAGAGETAFGLLPPYAQTAWPSLHRDSRNSDYAPFVTARAHKIAWRALQGAAVLPAPVAGPDGRLYVTTGRGPGFSHLHALGADGSLLWETAPQQSLDDLDSGAALSAPLVDESGDIYIADSNQIWAFRPAGSVKWVVPAPGPSPFASLVFTKEGYVGGVTLDGVAVFLSRDDGTQVVAPLALPGGAGPAAAPIPPSLWAGGLLDPAIVPTVYQMFLGRVFEVTNTPAVDPGTGRIFVVGAGQTPAEGALYGIDLTGGQAVIAWTAAVGAGSGTSPAVSPDGRVVYVADGAGALTATDAAGGGLVWTAAGSSVTSVTVGGDGTLYTGGAAVTALNPADGSVKWSRSYDWLAQSLLPTLPASPPFFTTGLPKARTNSVISASATRLHLALALGYEYTEPTTGATLLQPRLNLLAALDPATGSPLAATLAPDSNDGLVSIGADGGVYSAQAAMLSSIFYFGLNQLLPVYLRMPGPPPGGVTAYEPVSFLETATDGLQWVRALGSQAYVQLGEGPEGVVGAVTRIRVGTVQLGAVAGVAAQASQQGEIDAAAAQAVGQHAGAAYAQLAAALSLLAIEPTPSSAQIAAAAFWIASADGSLAAAIAALPP